MIGDISIGPDVWTKVFINHAQIVETWPLISNLCPQAYLSCVEGERLDVSLNASEWDSHVSPLDSDT
jgi:hypothetical protein